MIYLDHAATTSIHPEVLATLTESLAKDFANPASTHKLGRDLQAKITEHKTTIKKLLGINSADLFYFTSSATESNNTVIRGLNLTSGDGVIYSKADHKSIVEPIESLQKIGVELLPLSIEKNGEFLNSEFTTSANVKLIVLSLVNNQSGTIYRVNELSEQLKARFPKAHIHLDAVQGIGKIHYKLSPAIDSMSLTAHKIGGPKGIAGLFLKKNHQVKPLLLGGGQQDNFRSSTESYSLILAFTKALEISLLNLNRHFEVAQTNYAATKAFIEKLIPSAQFPFAQSSPYILCFIIPKIPSDVLIRHLESKEIYITSTSACSSRIKGFNSTMQALNIAEAYHKNVLRISFGAGQNNEEINRFCEVFLALWNDIAYLVK